VIRYVLVHGLGDSAETWAPVAVSLSADDQVDSWELPCHGARADELLLGRDLRDVARDIASLVEESPSPVVLVGHSAGGYSTLRAALVEGAPAIGLVVLNTGPGFRRQQDMITWNRSMDRLAARAGLPAEVGGLVHLHDSAVIEALPHGSVPTLVVQGADDLPVYRAGTEYIAAKLPSAELLEVRGAGHDPHHSHPGQVAAAILTFAARLPR
jgi:pimeloyl-ACP methyl ester carboxylesterase